jgi:protoporphyrinogen oxidase
MRSITRGEFILDIGRKELYSRIPEVNHLWAELLGADYRPYLHLVGILYDGHILASSRADQGMRRGMPWGMLLACSLDYFWGLMKPVASQPHNYEAYWYRKRGRHFSRILSQGFEEKFYCRKWAEMPPVDEFSGTGLTTLQAVKNQVLHALRKAAPEQTWRHPAKGTGQLCELLAQQILAGRGRIQYEAQITEIVTSPGRINAVRANIGSERVTYKPLHVVSSLPLEQLARLLLPEAAMVEDKNPRVITAPRRSTVLVYLFFDEPPRFPHAYLNVTCPKMRAGRITNYAAFNGDMVPKGKTCLCIEFFCWETDALLAMNPEELSDLALKECSKARLVEPTKCFDDLVIKLPGADAATNWHDWLTDTRLYYLTGLKKFGNLYNVQQPGTDKSTYAGLQAAATILSSDRTSFDHRTDPTQEEAWKTMVT